MRWSVGVLVVGFDRGVMGVFLLLSDRGARGGVFVQIFRSDD